MITIKIACYYQKQAGNKRLPVFPALFMKFIGVKPSLEIPIKKKPCNSHGLAVGRARRPS